jgi:Holliday junction resolvase RusA-like endonuclease
MTGIVIEVKGDPIPLQRARASRHGFYDPQYIAKKNYASEVKLQFSQTPLEHQLEVTFEFYFKTPKSWSKKKKALLINQPHTENKDLSNLIKFPEDALNGILWLDDRYISKISAFKKWAEESKTIIKVEMDL